MNRPKFMKVIRVAGSIIPRLAFLITLLAVPAAADPDRAATKIRVVAYNVACGQWATPESLSEKGPELKNQANLRSWIRIIAI
jgi:hypothetical protein